MKLKNLVWIIAIFLIPAGLGLQEGEGTREFSIEQGINVTTYQGIANTSGVMNCLNPEKANDADENSYMACSKAAGAGAFTYYLNFTLPDNFASVNVSILGETNEYYTYHYCENITGGYWVYLGQFYLTKFYRVYEIPDGCLSHETLNLRSQAQPSPGGTFNLYNYRINGSYHLINVSIFDEDTGNAITDNISLTFSTPDEELTTWTTSGYELLSGEVNETLTIKAGGSGYNTRYFSYQGAQQNIYLSKNSTNLVEFTFKDDLSSDTIADVLLIMERNINGSWVIVNSKLSDVTGRVKFNYVEGARYQFTATHSDYELKTWILDPVIFSSYTVKLTKSATAFYEEDYEGVRFGITPEKFYNNVLNNLTIRIISVTNSLQTYNVTVSYPGGANSSSGTTPAGESILIQLPITGAQAFDTVHVNLSYDTARSGKRNFGRSYQILGESAGFGTIASNQDNDYDLTAWERILIVTIVSIILAGLAYTVAGGLGAGFIILICQGVAAYLNFVPIWAALPTMLGAVVLLATRSAE